MATSTSPTAIASLGRVNALAAYLQRPRSRGFFIERGSAPAVSRPATPKRLYFAFIPQTMDLVVSFPARSL